MTRGARAGTRRSGRPSTATVVVNAVSRGHAGTGLARAGAPAAMAENQLGRKVNRMQQEAVFTEEGRHGLKLEIFPDWDAGNPREEWGMFGALWQEPFAVTSRTFRYEQDIEEDIRERRLDGETVIPVRFEDYGSSGARIRETDPEDATGFVYADRETIAGEYGGAGELERRKARALMRGELETVDAWLRGDVYGYAIEDAGGDTVDSCWGFYGGLEYERGEL